MRNYKCVRWVAILCTAAALTGLTGCESTHKAPKDGRTVGQKVDDDKITAKVKSALSAEPVYKFTAVHVKTYDGVVQLSGFVDSDQQKARAAEVAQRVPNVHRIDNAIALKPQMPTPTGRTNAAPGETTPPTTETPR